VLYHHRDTKNANKADIAASAQEAIVDVLTRKAIRAAKEFGARSVLLSGGVAANKALRIRLKKESKKLGIPLFVPDFKYNTDNAVMIAVASYVNLFHKKKYRLVAQGDRNL
jgi:N6-L-threonylcarbamoyladenine synthase